MTRKNQGWRHESYRHSLARRGIKTNYTINTPTTTIQNPDPHLYFDITDTDMPYYDDMIKKPEYFERAKAKKSKIIYMTPDEYMSRVAEQQGTTVQYQWDSIIEAKLQRLRDFISEGNKMPLMTIENTEHSHTQEGRHRAQIAKELGLKEVPVLVVWDIPESEWQQKYGDQY